MAKPRRYTKQMPFVGTATQETGIIGVAALIEVDKAPVIREGVDRLFGFVDGELAEGDTMKAAIKRAADRVRNPIRQDAEQPAVDSPVV